MNKATLNGLTYSLRIFGISVCLCLAMFIVMAPYAVYGLYLQPAIQAKVDQLLIHKKLALKGGEHGDSSQEQDRSVNQE